MTEQLKLRGEGLSWREVDDEIVGVDVRESTYVSANPSGKLLWKALAAGTTRQELVARLVETFEIDAERAGADVDAFVGQLREQGLLEE